MESDEIKSLRLQVAKFNLHLATFQQALLDKGLLTQAEIDDAYRKVKKQASEGLLPIALKTPGTLQ